jgi:hypothetical protein
MILIIVIVIMKPANAAPRLNCPYHELFISASYGGSIFAVELANGWDN